ncbi:hypothetical protein F2P45_18855 [Massilia sp. CCM 8733]|uniref:Uncharacterized protein n=1 Tax=Massilia mucilaginosa TaxID=2609282 RepID=A0ABX0NW31_9BURK|nr:hypothetical protein [Massilia mucilaginosa]NHZ91060.1 hypothetical protein [Massilia mucilaginosa]
MDPLAYAYFSLTDPRYSMRKIDDIVSADSRFRVAFVRRDDGTHGYAGFINTETAASPVWKLESKATSRFESHEVALNEARGRLAWLKKETDWPAKDREPVAAIEYTPGWMKCPFCGIRFCLQDLDRWGGGRHLTCGQRIVKQAHV